MRAVLLATVILALAIDRASQTSLVGAAPAAQGPVVDVSDTYRFEIGSIPQPVCLGQFIAIYMAVRPIRGYPGFGGTPLGEGYTNAIPGLVVDATLTNPSIGTIDPESKFFMTFWLEELPTEWLYVFEAKQAGKTNVYFETTIPADLTGTNSVGYLSSDPLEINVVNCEYEVSMSYKAQLIKGYYGPSHPALGSGRILPTKIKWNVKTNKYEGDADVQFSWLWKRRSPMAYDCDLDGRLQHNTTHITAELKSGKLTLLSFDSRWDLNPSDWGVAPACLGDLQGRWPPQRDLSRYGSGTTFPANGGIRILYPSAGDKHFRMMIKVKPIKP